MHTEEHTVGPEASADGKRNAYHITCPVVGHNRPYAACLRLCESTDARLNAMYSECSAAIGKKQCPALQMRREEIEAHRAIYFTERNKFAGLAASAASFLSDAGRKAYEAECIKFKAVTVVSEAVASKFTPSRKSSVIDQIDTTTYADVINAEVKKTATPVAPVAEVKPIAGESLFEMAKRMLAQSTLEK